MGAEVSTDSFIIHPAKITGVESADYKVTATIVVRNHLVEVYDIRVTNTTASITTNPTPKTSPKTFKVGRVIKENDTKYSVAKELGIDPSRIKNSVLRTGERIRYE